MDSPLSLTDDFFFVFFWRGDSDVENWRQELCRWLSGGRYWVHCLLFISYPPTFIHAKTTSRVLHGHLHYVNYLMYVSWWPPLQNKNKQTTLLSDTASRALPGCLHCVINHQSGVSNDHITYHVCLMITSPVMFLWWSHHQSCVSDGHITSHVCLLITSPVVCVWWSHNQSCVFDDHIISHVSHVCLFITSPVVCVWWSHHQSCASDDHITSHVCLMVT